MPVNPGAGAPLDTGDGGLGQTLNSATPPATVPVTHDTKFGMLMKVIGPALQGGLIGLAGGKGHPQGGFGAANDWFNQRRQMLLQQTMLQRQLQNDSQRNALEAARARYYDTRSGAYDTSQTAPVNPVAAPLRPGQMPSEAPPDLTPDNVPSQGAGVLSAKPQLRETDQGLMDVSGTTATPVTTRVPFKPSQFNSGSPQIDGIPVGGNRVPLRSPGSARPSGWKNQAEEDAALEYKTNHPDASSADLVRYVSGLTRAPKDTSGNMSPKEYRARQASLLTALNSGFRQIETSRQKQLAAMGGEFASANDLQELDQDTAEAKQTMHQRLVDQATAEGIDIGAVPDYRAQLQGANGKAPTTPPKSAPRSASSVAPTDDSEDPTDGARGKTASWSIVQAWAERKGITPTAAKQQFEARGYQVTGAPSGGVGSDRVSVMGPDGTPGTIPRAQMQRALKKGYKISSTSAGGVN